MDLSPADGSIVQSAVVQVDGGPVLRMWQPDEEVTAAPLGTAFRLPAGATVRLTVRYREQHQSAAASMNVAGRLGFYFTEAPVDGQEIRSIILSPSRRDVASSNPATSTSVTGGGMRALALRPLLDRDYQSVAVRATLPDGTMKTLLSLRAPRVGWPRRYWLREPCVLPSGTTLQVTAIPARSELDSGTITPIVGPDIEMSFVSRGSR
jgi:hypothetical protein